MSRWDRAESGASPPRLMGLSEACAEGVLSLSYDAVRKRRQRDPGSFPEPRGPAGHRGALRRDRTYGMGGAR